MNKEVIAKMRETEDFLIGMIKGAHDIADRLGVIRPVELEAVKILVDLFRIEADIKDEKEDPLAALQYMNEDTWTQEEMEGGEDKANICRQLLPVLQHTRAGEGIREMRYVPFFGSGDEAIEIKFMNGELKIVNVTADSGIAMIKDICKAIS